MFLLTCGAIQRVGWATKPNVEIGKGQNILRAIDVGLCSPTYGPDVFYVPQTETTFAERVTEQLKKIFSAGSQSDSAASAEKFEARTERRKNVNNFFICVLDDGA